MKKLTKKDLVQGITKLSPSLRPKETEQTLDCLVRILTFALDSGHSVTLQGLGTFTPKPRAARIARNPQTGEPVEVPAKTVIVFKASAKKGQ